MKDACAECQLYSLQIRTALPALKVVMLHGAFAFFRFSKLCPPPPPPPSFQAKLRHEQATHLRLASKEYDCNKYHRQYSMQIWIWVERT